MRRSGSPVICSVPTVRATIPDSVQCAARSQLRLELDALDPRAARVLTLKDRAARSRS